jgi:excisionase family DNA binding protein
MADFREVMNAREASRYLGVSKETLYKYLWQHRLPGFKLGNRWRFKKTVLDRWMERQSEQPKSRTRSKARSV